MIRKPHPFFALSLAACCFYIVMISSLLVNACTQTTKPASTTSQTVDQLPDCPKGDDTGMIFGMMPCKQTIDQNYNQTGH